MDQTVGFLFVCAVAMWIIIACRYSKKARMKRKRRRLLKERGHLINAKVRLGKGKRFDCPRCGSVEACTTCQGIGAKML